MRWEMFQVKAIITYTWLFRTSIKLNFKLILLNLHWIFKTYFSTLTISPRLLFVSFSFVRFAVLPSVVNFRSRQKCILMYGGNINLIDFLSFCRCLHLLTRRWHRPHSIKWHAIRDGFFQFRYFPNSEIGFSENNPINFSQLVHHSPHSFVKTKEKCECTGCVIFTTCTC